MSDTALLRRLQANATATAVGLAALAITSGASMAADAGHPTVVELFQSQGCSSCPPTNANVLAIAGRPDVLVLSWQVTYWDQLGWKDTFAKPAFTARQWDYAHALHERGVFTPQVVVNGRVDGVGNQREALDALVRSGDRGDGGPRVMVVGDHVTVDGGAGRAIVLLVRYDPNLLQVPISRGENNGHTLPHRNVVRDIEQLGNWDGGKQVYTLPAADHRGLASAILVQFGPGGRIIAAARG